MWTVKRTKPIVQPRFRISCGPNIALGPGKAELLEHVQEAGSIAGAARLMGMSYMRAWMLVKTMERCFKEPLIEIERGGARHGGAKLTANGRQVLELYRRMERQSELATKSSRRCILARLRT